MPKLIISSTIAFVTFSIGVIITGVFRDATVHVSKPHTGQLDQSFVATKPRELWPPGPNTNAAQYLDLSIVIEGSESNPNQPSLKRRHIKLLERESTVIDLDLGESTDNQEVTLNFQGNDEYRMFQRYRTSMSISAEGPHLDLVDWRHFDSAWTKLKALSSKRFRTLALNQMDASRFPSTTNDEIVEEIRRRVGTGWPEVLELAEDCDGPNDGACLVLISSIYLRIQKKVHTRWVDVGVIEIRQPMGC